MTRASPCMGSPPDVRLRRRLAAHATAETSRPWSGSAARSRSQIRSRQLPQPVPAAQASPTSSSVRAPSAMTSDSADSLTAKQMQTYTAEHSRRGRGFRGGVASLRETAENGCTDPDVLVDRCGHVDRDLLASRKSQLLYVDVCVYSFHGYDGLMPNKTIYVSDADLPLFQRAQELVGGNLSAAISKALHRLVEVEEGRLEGFQEITVRVGVEPGKLQRFQGVQLVDWNRTSSGASSSGGQERYRVYRTRAGKFAVHVALPKGFVHTAGKDGQLTGWRKHFVADQQWGETP